MDLVFVLEEIGTGTGLCLQWSGLDLVITYRWHHPLNHDLPVLFCSALLYLIILSRLDTGCIILNSNRVNSLPPPLTRTSQRLTCIRPRLDLFRTIITLASRSIHSRLVPPAYSVIAAAYSDKT